MEPGARLLGNRYELLSVLASGGMGRVWRARDVVLNRQVAVKVLRSEFTGDSAFIARFRAEAQHTALLHHPNIATVFDYGEAEESGEHLAYLVMELVEGESLASLLARERRLDPQRTLAVLRATAAALAAAHAAGVVHRDVKPGNVLVAPDGTVKITDFGIAWSASSVPLTQTGQVIGTAHYLSPEQAAGGQATPASDVYALGAVAYECLAGRPAFDGENSVQVAVKQIRELPDPLPPDVPAEVRGVVERAMAKDPAQRYPDGAALLAAVDGVLAGRPPVQRVPTGTAVMPLPLLGATSAAAPAPTRDGLRTFGRRAAIGAALALVALLAVTLAVGLFRDRSDAPAGEPTPATSSSAPETIDLVAAEYVGRPVADVQAELTALGLQVRLAPVETAEVPDGQVLAVEPTQGLVAGSPVTVTHAVAPPPPVDDRGDDDKDGDRGNGNGNEGNEGRGNDDDKDDDKDDD
jgi:hypothetical protein